MGLAILECAELLDENDKRDLEGRVSGKEETRGTR